MLTKLLIANRGEIAIRVARSAADLGLATVSVYSTDDAASAHARHADTNVALGIRGAAAYLDADRLIEVALETGCDAVHPGYGFLSESAAFARSVANAGLVFVGPSPANLDLFGDKVQARFAAAAADLAVLEASGHVTDAAAVRTFAATLGDGASVMIKAVAGGGGRGLRVVEHLADDNTFTEAVKQASAEALASFGNGSIFVERYLPNARHIEVQVVGDGTGQVVHLGDRDCSMQRRHQKLIEIAPAPGLPAGLRQRLADAAVRLAQSVNYANVGTIEFLVDATDLGNTSPFYFIEANPRLQVEHTVTEEVTGIDLVDWQLRLASGSTLADLAIDQANIPTPRGFAIQLRVNLETVQPDGTTRPSGGTLGPFDLPTGPGIRVDTFGYAGYSTSSSFDSLLAKVIVHRASSSFADLVARADRAMSECHIGGVETNVGFLRNVLAEPDFVNGRVTTRFVEQHIASLTRRPAEASPTRRFAPSPEASGVAGLGRGAAGVRLDSQDPLAVLAYGKAVSAASQTTSAVPPASGPSGTLALVSPLQGTIVSLTVAVDDQVKAGQLVAVMESMKMQHEIRATAAGTVRMLGAVEGDAVFADHPLVYFEPSGDHDDEAAEVEQINLDHIRPDLAEILERHAITLDEARPKAVARRRATGQRTARENVDDLCDPGTLVEYGPLVVAAQHKRRSMEELLEKSPADGMITGVASINGDLFGDPHSRCAVMAYDYTVFAGTQGIKNHQKTDRLLQLAEHGRMPLVLFAEGGGGRPGDTDGGDQGTWTFNHFARLSGLVPMIGITSGRCYAGNASLLGCCDVIIATKGSNIGMGGPAMIEGGGLGVFAPEDIGPLEVQLRSGVVDIAVEDEAEAVAAAKQYLSYFQGPIAPGDSVDQRLMRPIIPENRLRVYEVRRVIETLADIGSILELRRDFGIGIITSFIRVEGRPIGVVANNPMHLGGAIDSDGSDKGARFMQLCDAFDIPILFLVDTPGIMVGPEVEKTALVRHSSRMFLVGANLSVPCYTIILRKAYGLGCIAVSGASFRAPLFTVAWPTGEFGGMGLEGSVKLGFREVLASIEDPNERLMVYEKMVAKAYQKGKALRYASGFAIDDTIDPAESRHWLANLMASVRIDQRGPGKKRPYIDAW